MLFLFKSVLIESFVFSIIVNTVIQVTYERKFHDTSVYMNKEVGLS